MSFDQDKWTDEVIIAIFNVGRLWRWWYRFGMRSQQYKDEVKRLTRLCQTGSAYYEHAAERFIKNREHLLKTLRVGESYIR